MDATDQLAIADLLARSAYALDERQLDMLTDTFTTEVTLSIRIHGVTDEPRFEGREAVMGLMTGAMEEQSDQRRHVVTNLFFRQAQGDRAEVVSNVTITSVDQGAIRLVTSGLYEDEVVRQDGHWRINRRRILLDMPY